MNIDTIKDICDTHLVSFNGEWVTQTTVIEETQTVRFRLESGYYIVVDAQSLEETDYDDNGSGGIVYVMRDVTGVHHLVNFYSNTSIRVD